MDAHPVRLIVRDDLRRSRLTVFFRLLLALPHFVWVVLWTFAVVVAAFANWLVALVRGRPAAPLHRFLCAYLRYVTHLSAYLWLLANPYPPFDGRTGEYPVDLELPAPSAQSRWRTAFRLVLFLPAAFLSDTLAGGGGTTWTTHSGAKASVAWAGLAGTVSLLGWFVGLFRARMPIGLRDAGALGLAYQVQTAAYVLLLTERYPTADPTVLLADAERPPEHPVHVVGDAHDLRRSRVTVLFRVLLALPHLVWAALWGILVLLASIVQWFVTLVRGRPVEALHRFTVRWVRYRLHVLAFLFLAANPFPGFVGDPGSYPLDLELPGPARQNRWKTGFRGLLAIPAFFVNGALSGALLVAGVLMWFVALVRGAAPEGLRNLAAYALRYDAQTLAYVLFVTDAYPHASPLEGAFAEPVDA